MILEFIGEVRESHSEQKTEEGQKKLSFETHQPPVENKANVNENDQRHG
jgi:hypothetical protein